MSGIVSNIGNGTAAASNAIFFITDAGGSIITNAGNLPTSALNPSASEGKSSTYTFNTPGTYHYMLCADWNGGIAESNENNNCSAQVTVTVNATYPDLYAGSVSPTTATAGTAVTLSATVSNGGNGGTGSSFPNYFLVADGPNGGGNLIVVENPYAGPLAAGGSSSVSKTYTFPSAGTYSAVVCADQAPGWVSTVAESNEGNNCGPWTNITVVAPVPATPTGLTGSCNVSGTSASFSWNAPAYTTFYYVRIGATPAGSCPAGWQVVPWATTYCMPNPDSYSSTSIPSYSTVPGSSYAIEVYAANNSGYSSPATMNVTCNGQPDLTVTAAPTPTTATKGVPVTFAATAKNIGVATAYANPYIPTMFQVSDGHLIGGATINNVAANATAPFTSWAYTFSSAGTYQVRACADIGASWETAVAESNEDNNCGPWADVTVIAPTPTATLNASPTSVANGGSSTLTWSSTNTTSCTGTGFSTGGATSGSVSTGALSSTTNYQLTCTGSNGSANAFATVNVATPTATITVSPLRVADGGTVTVTWSCTNAATNSVTGPGLSSTELSGSQDVTVTGRQTYTETCGNATATATVNTVPKVIEF
jgi:hypothetical protein